MAVKQSYFHGTGRRKTSIAQVKIMPGNGAIIINGVPYEDLFPSVEHRRAILQPLLVTESLGKFNAMVKVNEENRLQIDSQRPPVSRLNIARFRHTGC